MKQHYIETLNYCFDFFNTKNIEETVLERQCQFIKSKVITKISPEEQNKFIEVMKDKEIIKDIFNEVKPFNIVVIDVDDINLESELLFNNLLKTYEKSNFFIKEQKILIMYRKFLDLKLSIAVLDLYPDFYFNKRYELKNLFQKILCGNYNEFKNNYDIIPNQFILDEIIKKNKENTVYIIANSQEADESLQKVLNDKIATFGLFSFNFLTSKNELNHNNCITGVIEETDYKYVDYSIIRSYDRNVKEYGLVYKIKN